MHAHPDDESSKGPATVARYSSEGVHCVLVTCTGGEEGDILNPALDNPEIRKHLGEVRSAELQEAVRIIGYDESILLGYRDSGMPGASANKHEHSFAMAPLEESVENLVKIIRRVKPQVIITYPEAQNEYPHPDHIRVHEISVAAFEAAGDQDQYVCAGPAFAPSKLYYSVWPRERYLAQHNKHLELKIPSPFDEKWLERLNRKEPITTTIDIRGFEDVRTRALKAHATQIDPNSSFWFGLPEDILHSIHPQDEFYLAKNLAGPLIQDGERYEDDLFAGLR